MMDVFFQLNFLNAKSFPYNNDKPLLTLTKDNKINDTNHGRAKRGKVNLQIKLLSSSYISGGFFANGQEFQKNCNDFTGIP